MVEFGEIWAGTLADSEQLEDIGIKNSVVYSTGSEILILFLSLVSCRCSSDFLETVSIFVRIFLELRFSNYFHQDFHLGHFWYLSLKTASASLNFYQHTAKSHHFI